MITEIYVPRAALADFMAEVADDFRANGVDVDLRHRPPDRARRRELPGLGARALGLRDLQPARRPHARRARARRPTRSAA